MRQPLLPALLLPLSALLGACSTAPSHDGPPLAVEVEDVEKVHREGNVLLTSQVGADGLRALADSGTTTLVDLRMPEEDRGYDESSLALELGLEYVALPIGSPDHVTDELLDTVRSLIANSEGDVVLQCRSANRSSVVWLAHRVLDDGVDWDTALAEARVSGLKSEPLAERVRAYVDARR